MNVYIFPQVLKLVFRKNGFEQLNKVEKLSVS